MFAEAPIGVMLPPRVAPVSRPKYIRYGSMPSEAVTAARTGSIVATYGMLSTKADISTEPQTMIVNNRNTLLPPIFTIRPAISSITPTLISPPMTIKRPTRRPSVP